MSSSGSRRRPSAPDDGAKLADEIIAALASVTGEHRVVVGDEARPARRTDAPRGGRDLARDLIRRDLARDLTAATSRET